MFQREKNWMPVAHKGKQLYVVYSIDPHVMLEVDTDLGSGVKTAGD